MKLLSRRTMLKGFGAAVSLPMLDIMADSPAVATNLSAASEAPNRVAWLYFPNGVADGSWLPQKTGKDGSLLKLNRWMKPLQPFKSKLLIPNNVWTPRGNGHGAGTATWLTAGSYDDRRIDAGGISVDQAIARRIGDQTLLPSLELGLKGDGYFTGDLPRNSISWRDSRTPLSRETEPRAVFDLMFRTSSSQGIDRSVVDLVREHARQIQRAGSQEDKRKIDEYLYSVRSIEKRLAFADRKTNETIRARELTNTLNRPTEGIPTDHQEYVRLMLDMMVLAFWSDATRVSTFMLDHGQSNRYFDFIPNCEGTWHALSHYRDISGRTEDDDGKTSWSSVESKRDMYNRVTMWHHQQLAYLLGRMDNIKERDGRSLLQNSIICYGSSLSDGNEHGETNLPMLVAGEGGGTIRSGRLLNHRKRTSMSKLHLAIMNRVGAKTNRFGETKSEMNLM